MGRTLRKLLEDDHRALAAELSACLSGDQVGLASFDRFRHHLLWHVAVEERLVMPALVKALGRPPPTAQGMRKDHAGIAALCVPRPEREWVENLRDLLDEHYRVEESAGGFYEACERTLPADVQAALVAAIEALPPLQLGAFTEGPLVRAQLKGVLEAVGISASPAPVKRPKRPR